jgi:hypothetical protein
VKANFSFRLLLTFEAVIFIFAGCTPTAQKPAEDWVVYKNSVYNYSFKYPSSCLSDALPAACQEQSFEEMAQECLCFLDKEEPRAVTLQTYLSNGDQLLLARFSISFIAAPSMEHGLITQLKKLVSITAKIPDKPNFSFPGTPAVRIDYPRAVEIYSHTEIYFLTNNALLKILMLNVDNRANKAWYDQILSTFKIEYLFIKNDIAMNVSP